MSVAEYLTNDPGATGAQNRFRISRSSDLDGEVVTVFDNPDDLYIFVKTSDIDGESRTHLVSFETGNRWNSIPATRLDAVYVVGTTTPA